MSENAKYKVGLIGAGRAGVPRARAFDLHPLCEVVAIADTDRANLDLAAGRFGVPGYETWDEMLENHDLDIGMAVLPVRPNADAVVALAQAGVKTIFCEKPLTGSLADADRMVEETSSRGDSPRMRRCRVQFTRLPEGISARGRWGDRQHRSHQPLREQ